MTLPDKRSRPEMGIPGTAHTLKADTDSLPDPAEFDLLTCSPAEFVAFLAGYRTGLTQATQAADRRRDEEDRAVYAMAVRNVRAMAKIPPYDEHQEAVLRRTFEAAARNRAAETRWSA